MVLEAHDGTEIHEGERSFFTVSFFGSGLDLPGRHFGLRSPGVTLLELVDVI